MNDHTCIDSTEVEDVLALEPFSSRRARIEECPRCRALLLDYVSFLEDRSVPEGAEAGAAAVRLRSAWESGIRRPPEVGGWADRLWPWRRLAGVAAALLLVAAGLWGGWQIAGDRAEVPILRGGGPGGSEGGPGTLRMVAAGADGEGGLEARWRRMPGADSYELRILGPDLAVLRSAGPLRDTLVVIPRSQLPPGALDGPVGIQVAAQRGGSEIARSAVRALRLSAPETRP